MSVLNKNLSHLLAGLTDNSVGQINVTGLSLDSRQLEQGNAFIAIKGSKSHGLEYLEAALDKKPSVVIYEPTEKYSDINVINVPAIAINDLHQHVSLIASRFYSDPSADLNITAITGTNGKTTCAYLLASLLEALNVKTAMIGTLGTGRLHELKTASLTTPDAISLQAQLAGFRDAGVEHVVMEASSHALHQYRLDAVAVDIAAFTNLSQDHLDYHKNMPAYLQAKKRLFAFPALSHAVINADDLAASEIMSVVPSMAKTITYSIDGTDQTSSLVAKSIQADARSTRFKLVLDATEIELETNLLGEFNVSNMLLVLAVMQAWGYESTSLIESIRQLEAPAGRMQRLSTDYTPTVVIDYAHTPDALEKTLSTLKNIASDELVAVFGCGGDRDRSKRALMGGVAERYADQIYLTDDNPRTETSGQIIADIQSGISVHKKTHIIQDRAKAIEVSIHAAKAKDIVLIAGKGHEEYQIIGNEKLPFSDRSHAQAALSSWQELRA